jgi:hypothetical protein
MKRTILTTFALLGALAPAVQALSYDQNVTPGVYYGIGNGNGYWTVDTSNDIELGLRSHKRYAGVYNSGGNGTYAWTAADPWNFDFSINVAATGNTVDDFQFQLWIDSDPGAGQIWTMFDPVHQYITDNASPGLPYGPTDLSSPYAQNSEFFPWFVPGYDNTIAGSYDFSLRALDATGALAANTYMRVNVNGGTASGSFDGNVPDAGTTLSLLGLSLAGLGALRRKLRP